MGGTFTSLQCNSFVGLSALSYIIKHAFYSIVALFQCSGFLHLLLSSSSLNTHALNCGQHSELHFKLNILDATDNQMLVFNTKVRYIHIAHSFSFPLCCSAWILILIGDLPKYSLAYLSFFCCCCYL